MNRKRRIEKGFGEKRYKRGPCHVAITILCALEAILGWEQTQMGNRPEDSELGQRDRTEGLGKGP